MIDQIDLLANTKRQVILYSILDFLKQTKSRILLIGISSDLKFVEKLEKRVKSRLS
jgi:Cdc6-like AAA superfamily ATPase